MAMKIHFTLYKRLLTKCKRCSHLVMDKTVKVHYSFHVPKWVLPVVCRIYGQSNDTVVTNRRVSVWNRHLLSWNFTAILSLFYRWGKGLREVPKAIRLVLGRKGVQAFKSQLCQHTCEILVKLFNFSKPQFPYL